MMKEHTGTSPAAREHGRLGGRRFVAMLPALVLLLTIGVLPASAAAQSTTLLVLPDRVEGLTIEDADDIYEELSYVSEDTGSFLVTRHYQLPDLIGDIGYARAVACRGDAACLGDNDELNAFDYVLIVDLSRAASGFGLRLRLVDRWARSQVDVEEATLASETDFETLERAALSLFGRAGYATDEAPPAVAEAPADVPPPTDDPVRRPPEAPGDGMPSLGNWLMIGGAAGLTGGVLLGFAADATQQDLQSRPRPASEVEDLQSRGEAQALASTILMITGGAVLAGGLVVTILEARETNESSGRISDVRLEMDPLGSSVRLRGRFR